MVARAGPPSCGDTGPNCVTNPCAGQAPPSSCCERQHPSRLGLSMYERRLLAGLTGMEGLAGGARLTCGDRCRPTLLGRFDFAKQPLLQPVVSIVGGVPYNHYIWYPVDDVWGSCRAPPRRRQRAAQEAFNHRAQRSVRCSGHAPGPDSHSRFSHARVQRFRINDCCIAASSPSCLGAVGALWTGRAARVRSDRGTTND